MEGNVYTFDLRMNIKNGGVTRVGFHNNKAQYRAMHDPRQGGHHPQFALVQDSYDQKTATSKKL